MAGESAAVKILIISDPKRVEKHTPKGAVPAGAEVVVRELGTPEAELLREHSDARILIVDAIGAAGRGLIEGMPGLRLIHSEGVGYEGVDLAAAAERGVYVCNNKGVNAGAVAEQAVLLMLALLRNAVWGDGAVRAGRQIQAKYAAMIEGITELGDCTVGIVGLGDIGRATAARLRAFGCKLLYYSLHRKPAEEEAALGVEYAPLFDLASRSDIVSVHVAINRETTGMIDRAFLARMKPTAYLVNTARGEAVDNAALREALVAGRIAGAGLDTIYPEPTTADNPLVDLPAGLRARVVYSPHFGGITTGTMRRAQKHIWENVNRVLRGERPDCIVNGL